MKNLIISCLFFAFASCASKQEPAKAEPVNGTANTEANKEMIRRVYAEMVNQRKYALLDSFFATDIVDHSAWEGQLPGREGFKKSFTDFMSLFSAAEVKVEEVVAEGNIVATLETWNVTMSSTNKALKGQTMHFFRIQDGHIVDEWSKGWDWLGL